MTDYANMGGDPRASFVNRVRLRGNDCSLKRHFRGCCREVVGYLELLAARDSERFVFASLKNIAQHAHKFDRCDCVAAAHQSGFLPDTYSPTTVKKAIRFLVLLGVLTGGSRERHGRERKGWFVAEHYTAAEEAWCVLLADGPATTSIHAEVVDGRGPIVEGECLLEGQDLPF